MFKKYRSVPQTVEAVQFNMRNKDQVFNSLTGQFAAGFENDEPILRITTIHGDIAIVRIGDYIVKEATPGFYYPVKNNIFVGKYIPE